MTEHTLQPQAGELVVESAAGPAALQPEPNRFRGPRVTLLQTAVDRGADIDTLERLIALQERQEAKVALDKFTAALIKFQANVPLIKKTRKAHNTMYAGLAETLDTINPAMKANGLSRSWTSVQEGDNITVTCKISHKAGHSETTSLTGPNDTTGSKNDIQSVGSAKTYLERYTLFGILGLASADQDYDGEHVDVITDVQCTQALKLLVDSEIPPAKFYAWLLQEKKVKHMDRLPSNEYKSVVRKLNLTIEKNRDSS